MTCDHEWTNLHNEDSDAFCNLCGVIGVPCDDCDSTGYWQIEGYDDAIIDEGPCLKCAGTGTTVYVPATQADRLAALGRHPSHSPFAMQRT